jgi:uncharacterized protein with gpF-like domain
MKKAALTRSRQEWAKRFKPKTLAGPPIEANAGVAAWYSGKLDKFVLEMKALALRELKTLFQVEARAFSQDASLSSQARIGMNALERVLDKLFRQKAEQMAEGMLRMNNKANASGVHISLKELSGGLNIKTDFISGKLQEKLKAAISENVGMINSIKREFHDKVAGAVMRSITSGNGLQDLVPELDKIEGLSKTRARFIARDQTRRANAMLTRQRLEDAGIQYFKWVHSRLAGRSACRRRPAARHQKEPKGRRSGPAAPPTRPPG